MNEHADVKAERRQDAEGQGQAGAGDARGDNLRPAFSLRGGSGPDAEDFLRLRAEVHDLGVHRQVVRQEPREQRDDDEEADIQIDGDAKELEDFEAAAEHPGTLAPPSG